MFNYRFFLKFKVIKNILIFFKFLKNKNKYIGEKLKIRYNFNEI